MQQADKTVKPQADVAGRKSSPRLSPATASLENSPFLVAQRRQLGSLFGQAALPTCAGEGVVQRHILSDIKGAKQIAVIGENHDHYDEGNELGKERRKAEREACLKNGLAYKTEPEFFSLMPLEEKAPASSAGAAAATAADPKPASVSVLPDDPLLRVGMFAEKLRSKIMKEVSGDMLGREIRAFRTEAMSGLNEDPVEGALLKPSEAYHVEKFEKDAHLICLNGRFRPHIVKANYIPFLDHLISLYHEKTPPNIKALADGLTTIKKQSGPDDVASARRSLWMYQSIGKWANRIAPTVYKVGDEHVTDMKSAQKLMLPTSERVQLFTAQEIGNQIADADPEAFKRVKELAAAETKSASAGDAAVPFVGAKPKMSGSRRPPSKKTFGAATASAAAAPAEPSAEEIDLRQVMEELVTTTADDAIDDLTEKAAIKKKLDATLYDD